MDSDEKKVIINTLIENYDVFKEIMKYTEYETYVGELKSELEKARLSKKLWQLFETTYSYNSFFGVLFRFPNINNYDKKISNLQNQITKAESQLLQKYEVADQILLLFKGYVNETNDRNLLVDIEKINLNILKITFEVLKSSTAHQLNKLEDKISKGKMYLAQMKDAKIDFDKIIIKMSKFDSIEANKKNISELKVLHGEVLNALYKADLSIEDSKWLRVITYFGFSVTVLGFVIGIISTIIR